MSDVLDRQAEKLAITRRISADITEIWALQPRFERRTGKMPYRLLEQARYRAGWDFLRLRAQSGEMPMELPDWWEAFASADTAERDDMLRTPPADVAPRKRRRTRRKKPATAGSTADAE